MSRVAKVLLVLCIKLFLKSVKSDLPNTLPVEPTPVISSSTALAYSVPEVNVALSGTPFSVIPDISRVQCFGQCVERECSSFNYDENNCELFSTYLCDGTGNQLIYRNSSHYYDVEMGYFYLPKADDYLNEENCTNLNRCSPKCYVTEQGYVGLPCLNFTCLTNFSDCRSNATCECIAGYSYQLSTRSCVTVCSGGYGTGFTKTAHSRIREDKIEEYEDVTVEICKSNCLVYPHCSIFVYDLERGECFLSSLTFEDERLNRIDYEPDKSYYYYQRDCE